MILMKLEEELMKILLNLSRLQTLKITPNQLVYLISQFTNQLNYFTITQDEIDHLQTQSFLKITKEGIVLRAKTNNLMKELGISSVDNLEKLVDDYRALFPAGYKTFGHAIKGDRTNCLKKLKEFKTKFPYTNDEILEATRSYLAIKKKNRYEGTQLSHYYIEKDGISNLASMCESIRDTPDSIQESQGIGSTKSI